MHSKLHSIFDSRILLWTGRIISALVILQLLVSGVFGLMKPPIAVQGNLALGFPENLVVGMGAILTSCTLLYAIPSTSVLGAILLTGYLGGAVAAHLRIGSSALETLVPAIIGIFVWGGLFLREPRLRTLLPLKS